MEFLQLQYFYESARCESLAKTAKKFMVPPSSVSASIKRLEEELGCKLFDRSANRITLNDKGRQLQKSIGVIFGELEHAVDLIKGAENDTREVRVLVRALRSAVTDFVIRYKKENVNAKFRLVVDFDENDFEAFDIIIDTERDSYLGYERFVLCRQRVELYASQSSPLCERDLTLSQLSHQLFVMMSPRGYHYKLLIDACERAGFIPEVLAQINDIDCYLKLIASGAAIGTAGEYSARGNVQILPLRVSDFKEWQTVCVFYKADSAFGNVKRFIDFLRKEAK